MTKTAVKLITLAATLSVTKAQDDEEMEGNQGELYQLMMIYTILVIFSTLLIQALWKVGVGRVGRNLKEKVFGREAESQRGRSSKHDGCGMTERPSSLPPAGSDSPGEDGLETTEGSPVQLPVAAGSTSDAGGDGLEVQVRPLVQLPAAGRLEGLRVEERPSVHLPAGPTQPRTPVNLGPNDQNASSSSNGSSSTNVDLNTRIEAALHDIAVEEVELWRHYRQHGHFPPGRDDFSGVGLGFQVYRTPCGTVYHSTRFCTQLKGPRTGYPREFTWCELCREVGLRTRGRPPSGSPLMLLTSGQVLHTDPRCPRNQATHEFRGCMYCTDFDG